MTDDICVEEYFVFTLQQRGPISHHPQARQAGNLWYFTTVRSWQQIFPSECTWECGMPANAPAERRHWCTL